MGIGYFEFLPFAFCGVRGRRRDSSFLLVDGQIVLFDDGEQRLLGRVLQKVLQFRFSCPVPYEGLTFLLFVYTIRFNFITNV